MVRSKRLNFQHIFIIFLHSYCVHQYCSPLSSIFGVLSPKQPPCPALMMYFPVRFLSGTHHNELTFTLQKLCGQMSPRHLGKRFEWMRLEGRFHLYLALTTWSDLPECILIPSVIGPYMIRVSCINKQNVYTYIDMNYGQKTPQSWKLMTTLTRFLSLILGQKNRVWW